MRRKLILDTDGGVDDAQALLMLVAADRAPDLITTVSGNVGLDVATRNILSVLTVAGRDDIPVHMGAGQPLVQPLHNATEIHGADGLGGAPRPVLKAEPAGKDGVGTIIANLQDAALQSEKIDFLMIGPLTNLALVLSLAPDCVAGIGQVTIMGGSVYGRGNITPAAEFNIFADPEAARIVFAAEIEITLIPWESCTAHKITGAQVDALLAARPDGVAKAFSQALVRHARSIVAGFGGGDHFRFVDTLAAAVVIDPGLVSRSLQASVDVALAPGLTRGMTVVDPSGRLGTPMRTIIEMADLTGVANLYAASIDYVAAK